jgi:hypothetical protein
MTRPHRNDGERAIDRVPGEDVPGSSPGEKAPLHELGRPVDMGNPSAAPRVFVERRCDLRD